MIDSRDLNKLKAEAAKIEAGIGTMVKSPLDEIRFQQGVLEGLRQAMKLLEGTDEDEGNNRRTRYP